MCQRTGDQSRSAWTVVLPKTLTLATVTIILVAALDAVTIPRTIVVGRFTAFGMAVGRVEADSSFCAAAVWVASAFQSGLYPRKGGENSDDWNEKFHLGLFFAVRFERRGK
jgi:hypothetical protein